MSTDVEVYRPWSNDQGNVARWVGLLEPAVKLAELVAQTAFVPASMRGKPDVIAAAIMYGDELGVSPMQALTGIDVVEGKAQPSAQLMRALIFRAGHTMEVLETTGQLCTVKGKRGDNGVELVVTWSMDMARTAGLAGRSVWGKYPRAMLLARATTELARGLFPDVIRGLGHVQDSVAVAQQWEDLERPTELPQAEQAKAISAPTKTVRRKRQPSPSPAQPAPADKPPPAPAGGGAPGIVDVPLPGMPAPPAGLPEPGTGPGKPAKAETAPPPRPDPDGPMDEATRRNAFAALDRAGITREDRELRLEVAAAAVGHSVTSWSELTRREAMTLIRQLNEVEQGLLEVRRAADGQVWLLAPEGTEPPPEEDL